MSFLAFLAGLIPGLILISPTEWLVHKYLLHVPKEQRKWFNKASSFAHNDVHHAAFKGPAHYYRDIVNEHVVIHFHPKHVAFIFVAALTTGVAVNRLYTFFILSDMSFSLADGAFVLGLVLAAAVGYLGYEINHHYMHVIGERRLTINRVLGDLLQGGKKQRDGNLRFSKPLLDTLCNAVEQCVDRYASARKSVSFSFDPLLVERFKEQMQYNMEVLKVHLENASGQSVLEETAHIMLEREKIKRSSLGTLRRMRYSIDRKIQWLFRGSHFFFGKYFRHIDNNHFMHHHRNDINLNVFLTWADKVFGTRRDSSPRALEQNKEYWLCPNSPDIQPFSLGNEVPAS